MPPLQRFDSAVSRPAGDLLDRVPPHNLDAERGVLGSILINPDLCDEIALLLRPDDFYSDAHQKIYQHFLDILNEGGKIDSMLLLERMRQHGDLEMVGGTGYLAELANCVPTPAHAVYYADIVSRKSMLRGLIRAGTEIVRDSFDEGVDARETLSQAEAKIFQILEQRGGGQVETIHNVLQMAFDRIDARMHREHGLGGVETGFVDFDNMTGGLHENELIILAARPSMGKTALALNIAEYVAAEARVATLVVSLEMSKLELGDRMLCSRAEVNAHRLRDGTVTPAINAKLVEAGAELSKAPLFIDDTPGRTMTEIAAAARRLKRREGLGLVVIDYLQLIEPDNSKDPRQEQVARIARRLKGLARELKIPVLCLAQLNRQAEATKDNRPRLSHLRESGAIEQDADVVMFIHREEYYHSREEAELHNMVGKAELIIAKQRNGPVGDVPLAWRPEFTRFNSASRQRRDEY
jgi:replicative DNA helicase